MELIGPRPGVRVLDVGAGTGLVAVPVAQTVGALGNVVALDIAKAMLRELTRAAAGIDNVRLILGDAEQPPFRDAAFDWVVAASVIFFLPDPAAALREWWRVLKPGGRVLSTVWGEGLDQPE